MTSAAATARWVAAVSDDAYYGPLWRSTGDVDLVTAAGFFDDGLDAASRRSWDLTSLPTDRLGGGDGTVLVATGGFGPLHGGHIEMMERAADALRARGETILGGYMCCDHDGYMATKELGERWRAERRLDTAADLLADHPWLMVDTWAALAAAGPLNFTTICNHISAQLRRVRPDATIDVVYVFGSDNAAFVDTFRHHGRGVCVTRPGHPAPNETPRVIVVDGARTDASTPLRRHDMTTAGTLDGLYVIRDDLTRATAALDLDPGALDEFRTGLISTIRDAVDATVRVVTVDDTDAVAAAINGPTVTLDAYGFGTAHLELSRRFRDDGIQRRAGALQARPGRPPIAAQLEQIRRSLPTATCTLVDDDISTGATTRAAVELLAAAGITVTGVVTTIDAAVRGAVADVVDLRDFLVGAHHGGLVVDSDSGPARFPYAAPYVALWNRASVRAGASIAASQRIWELNAQLWSTGTATIDQLDGGFVAVAAPRCPADTTIAALCAHHAAELSTGRQVDSADLVTANASTAA